MHYAVSASFYGDGKPCKLSPVFDPKPYPTDEVYTADKKKEKPKPK